VNQFSVVFLVFFEWSSHDEGNMFFVEFVNFLVEASQLFLFVF